MALTWDDFETALAKVLGTLEDGSRLIIHSLEVEDYYVQCAIDAGLPLTLEAVGDAFLDDGVKVGAEGAAELTALGWQPPREAPGNWWVDVTWPGTTAELGAAARLLAATLRTVFRTGEAQRLYYTAWRDPGAEPLEFLGLGIERID